MRFCYDIKFIKIDCIIIDVCVWIGLDFIERLSDIGINCLNVYEVGN